MINEQATYERFGYHSTDLAPFSNKLVVATCELYDEDREVIKYVGVKSRICIKCQRVQQALKISRINRFGRKLSEETKAKMRESAKKRDQSGPNSYWFGRKRSESNRRAISESNRNRVITAETRKKMSDARKGKSLPKEQREKMGNSRRGERNPNYGHKAAHGKSYYYTRKNKEVVRFRSLWEAAVARYLDDNGYDWEYEPNCYPIHYIHNGEEKNGTFRPDFEVLLNSDKQLWEVKGFWRDDAKVKFDAFLEQYGDLHIRLLEREQLIELGLVDKHGTVIGDII